MPFKIEIMPKRRRGPNRLVAALLHDGLAAFETGIVAEVFGLHRPEMQPDWYRFVTVAEKPGPLRATGGLRVIAQAGLERLADAGTIVIPCWRTDRVDLFRSVSACGVRTPCGSQSDDALASCREAAHDVSDCRRRRERALRR